MFVMEIQQKTETKRINGYLHKVVPILDGAGKVINYALQPLMVELKPRDIMQIVVGASILAVPVGFTEEVWKLSQELPMKNIYMLAGVSIFFIASFVYFNFYRFQLKNHVFEYIKRVCAIYFISLTVVGILLLLINKLPILTDIKAVIRTLVIVAFPASMSAAISDTIK